MLFAGGGARATLGEYLEGAIKTGEALGPYRIESVVAEGRTATVYRGTDSRDGRAVAIKVPHPYMEKDQTFADWFRREREIAERLDHPGIIKVIADGGGNSMVMEWFEGKPLRRVLEEEKRLAPERAVRIAVAICSALEYLHGMGIVHRDLQPENILVGAGDAIKLLDFGGAAKTQARRLTFTKLAQIAGASNYISPEELLGKRGDARSDIYALGLILYEMLTGREAYPAADLSDRLLNYPVPPREIDPAISPQLQEVNYRAMEREPRNRYASAREFAHDLEHLDQVGVAERVELREWRKRRSWKRRRILLYVALAMIPVVIFCLLILFARE